jgi:hypothetical protein
MPRILQPRIKRSTDSRNVLASHSKFLDESTTSMVRYRHTESLLSTLVYLVDIELER